MNFQMPERKKFSWKCPDCHVEKEVFSEEVLHILKEIHLNQHKRQSAAVRSFKFSALDPANADNFQHMLDDEDRKFLIACGIGW